MDILNIRFSNSLTATKCQNQRHEAIERYKRKFLQVFNTFPSHLPGALHNTSGKSQRNIESQGETGGQQRERGRRRGRMGSNFGGGHQGDAHAGGVQDNGHRRQAGRRCRRMRGQKEGRPAGDVGQGGWYQDEASRTEAGRDSNGGRQRNRERYWLNCSFPY